MLSAERTFSSCWVNSGVVYRSALTRVWRRVQSLGTLSWLAMLTSRQNPKLLEYLMRRLLIPLSSFCLVRNCSSQWSALVLSSRSSSSSGLYPFRNIPPLVISIGGSGTIAWSSCVARSWNWLSMAEFWLNSGWCEFWHQVDSSGNWFSDWASQRTSRAFPRPMAMRARARGRSHIFSSKFSRVDSLFDSVTSSWMALLRAVILSASSSGLAIQFLSVLPPMAVPGLVKTDQSVLAVSSLRSGANTSRCCRVWASRCMAPFPSYRTSLRTWLSSLRCVSWR